MNVDRIVVEVLNGAADRSDALQRAAIWASGSLPAIFVLALVLGGLSAAAGHLRRRDLPFRFVQGPLVALLSLALGLLANRLIGFFWFRPRPFDSISGVHLLVPRSLDPSFPSDHATATLALALGIGIAVPWLRNVLLVESFLILAGRIAVGLHYPSDMLAGLCIALVAVAISRSLTFWFRGVVRAAVAPVETLGLRLGSPEDFPDRQSQALWAAGILAALVGMPMVLEVAADPVRLHPGWLEYSFLGALWAALAVLAVGILRAGALLLRRTATSGGSAGHPWPS